MINMGTTTLPQGYAWVWSQYSSKFVEVHGNSKDMSDEVLGKTFENCALSLRPMFYPMCREEILKRTGDGDVHFRNIEGLQ